jgi:hypothetical protein
MSEHLRCYIPRKFGPAALDAIVKANQIIEEYDRKGFQLTLRQLYYQHVARGLIENSQASYNRLGNLISDARLAGLTSWTAIEDRTRNLMGLTTYHSPQALIQTLRGQSYRRDLWEDQPIRPEVWVEKDALSDVVGQICNRLRVDFFACRGYVSQSEQWRAGQRLRGYIQKGQRPIIFHFGDHDPSGLDVTRDNTARLSMFAGTPVQVVRLALNMNQVQQYNPPPNPAKITDSRFADYQRLYGDASWELDALEPSVIQDLIENNILRVRDGRLWDEALRQESLERQELNDILDEIGGPEDGELSS